MHIYIYKKQEKLITSLNLYLWILWHVLFSGIRCVITQRPDLNPHMLSKNGLEMEPLTVTCPDTSPLPFALQVEDGYETGSFTSTATTAPPSPDLPRPTEACNEPIRSFGPENGGCQEQLVI